MVTAISIAGVTAGVAAESVALVGPKILSICAAADRGFCATSTVRSWLKSDPFEAFGAGFCTTSIALSSLLSASAAPASSRVAGTRSSTSAIAGWP